MISDLVFDFFGTLVDYTPGYLVGAPYEATYRLVRGAGVDVSYEAFASGFAAAFDSCEAGAQATLREFPMDVVVRAFVEAHARDAVPDEAIASITVQYVADWNRGTTFFPGLRSLVRELAGRYRLSILSNTHYAQLIHGNLAAMGVADQFAQVVTSVEVGLRKPHPAIFAHALARLGITAEQAIYIGDSYAADYLGATQAGMRALLIDARGRHPEAAEARLASLSELPARLRASAGLL